MTLSASTVDLAERAYSSSAVCTFLPALVIARVANTGSDSSCFGPRLVLGRLGFLALSQQSCELAASSGLIIGHEGLRPRPVREKRALRLPTCIGMRATQ